MAISGLFTFAFTTSVLFSLVSEHQHLVDDLASRK